MQLAALHAATSDHEHCLSFSIPARPALPERAILTPRCVVPRTPSGFGRSVTVPRAHLPTVTGAGSTQSPRPSTQSICRLPASLIAFGIASTLPAAACLLLSSTSSQTNAILPTVDELHATGQNVPHRFLISLLDGIGRAPHSGAGLYCAYAQPNPRFAVSAHAGNDPFCNPISKVKLFFTARGLVKDHWQELSSPSRVDGAARSRGYAQLRKASKSVGSAGRSARQRAESAVALPTRDKRRSSASLSRSPLRSHRP